MSPALRSGRSRSPIFPGPDFPHFGLGRRVLYIRRDLAPRATQIFAALAQLDRSRSSYDGSQVDLWMLAGCEM